MTHSPDRAAPGGPGRGPDLAALGLEKKAALLSGDGFWRTTAAPEADVPSVVLADGPHGVRLQRSGGDHLGLGASEPATCFPTAVAVGSSWDPAVASQVGRAIAAEAQALGADVVLGPGVNIKRTPLCGRNFEYYSEDPLLSGVLGAAHVAAMEDAGTSSSVKHFAANNQETDRLSISAEVDERTLREIYLPAFERVITQARPATVMCAYNKVNGVFASEHRWLLTELLRQEWGFDGLVVSDWGAVHDRVAALRAGLDLQMPGDGGAGDRAVVDAVVHGQIDSDVVDVAANRVARLATRRRPAGARLDFDAHHALARRLASECLVLLKNDHEVLPLEAGATVGVVGAFATTPRFQGGGSSRVNAARADVPLDEIRRAVMERGGTVLHAAGFALDDGLDPVDADRLREQALEIAGRSDIVVIMAGLPESAESEGFDRDTLELPQNQQQLILACAARAPRTVVVLARGGAVSVEGWHEHVDAILDAPLLGQAAGGAIADVLVGAREPSGRLAESVPRRLQDTAAFLNFPGENGVVRYGEGVMVGYRYHTTAEVPARYPFGHGLGYGRVATSQPRLVELGSDNARVEVDVTNTGNRATRHVVQVYVATTTGPVRRPVRELRAFTKIALEPGQSRTTSFDLDRRAFAYWDVTYCRWVVPGGEYRVQVCSDAESVLGEISLRLPGDVLIPTLSMASELGRWISHPDFGAELAAQIEAALAPLADAAQEADVDGLRGISSMPLGQFLDMIGAALPPGSLDGVRDITDRHLAAAT